MSGNFTCWLFRKYSPVHWLTLIKQRRFFVTDSLCNTYGHKHNILTSLGSCLGQRFLGSCLPIPRKYGHRFLGNSKWPKSWNFYDIGAAKFPCGFHKSCVFSTQNHCHGQFSRKFSSSRNHYQQRNRTTATYTIALVIVVLGASYAAVPLYRIFCQASGLGGTVQQSDAGEKIKNMTTRKERLLTVRFNADKSATMQWSFKPQQPEVKVYPGETALAFYTAKNPTDVPITGISTYNVIPFEAGQYFNKIQCFCFEEQRLNPHEQVDMPVFFYIDPEFLDDPALYKVDTITLSYTFFQAKEAHDLGI
ncbi:cytochrome c oxidase assembly protein COX11, mitochondrial-like [Dendronephthya gigantea]|uniref:cytochrome c oxidase assembly protein COX11, mitochondrial-like n=1 Tax=Dendronephthya gigantea TaxID=151771 RepID=UPI00106BC931|nr:cytochrome c oxidase assembly protein COX11, mitochondrial-like [Dendronephthya gigantea]